MNKGKITISYTVLRKCALLFIALPLLCFFLGWLKWYWAGLACIALIVCFLASNETSRLNSLFLKRGNNYKTSDSDISGICNKKLVISKKVLVTIILCSCIYLIFCGIGRLWAQNEDQVWRNAIFRDLIVHNWPVYYDSYDGALCYYIGVWLPAAIPAKIVCFLSGNTETAFTVGNIALLIYYTIGLSIVFLLLISYFQVEKSKQIFLIVIGFILFSGMDILGVIFIDQAIVTIGHIEWWSSFQYSSLTTCLCWVYNQALIPWICILLLLHEKKISNFVFVGMACLFCGPFPFIGYLVYAVTLGVKRLVEMLKAKEGKQFAGEVFSISNISAALLIFPFIGSYLTSNTFVHDTGVESTFASFLGWDSKAYFLYLIFIAFEFGIFALLILKANKKNSLFYVTVIQLLVFPFINFGVNSDFTMRASIPAIFMMFVLCYQYLLTNSMVIPYKGNKLKGKADRSIAKVDIKYIMLVLCLLIGAITPSVEFARGIKQVNERGINDPETDYLVTLDQDGNSALNSIFQYTYVPINSFRWPPENFTSLNYEDTLFFKYFARDRITSI